MRPLVGIPLTLDAQLRAGRRSWFSDAAYGEALTAAGGFARYLGAGAQRPGDALADLDALLIPGGDDFPPASPYPPGVVFRPTEPEQIARDLALVAEARARGMPVLGICYGMQLLALVAGGELLFDIPHDVPGAVPHRLAPRERHALALAPGSRLAALFGDAREIAVNSRHHQGVASPGAGLAASARSADGVIEAIESPRGEPFALGVQWHPEDMEPEHARRIYGALVGAARARL